MALAQREKKIVVGLGLLLAVAVIFAGSQLVGHRGSSDAKTSVLGDPGASPQPIPSPTRDKNLNSKPPSFNGIDPFTTEVVAPPPPSPSPSPVPSPTPSPTSSLGPSSAVVGGHTVTLLDVFQQGGTDEAVVMVDGTVYTVKVGNSFAVDYKVESLQDPCGSFSWKHDQTFDLCGPSNGT
jgi:hypothetical protein